MAPRKRSVVVAESADKPYGQAVTIGPHTMRADEAETWGMRRSLARFSGPESLVHARSMADFITIRLGLGFRYTQESF